MGRGEIVGLLGPQRGGQDDDDADADDVPAADQRPRRLSPGTTCSTSRWRSAGRVGYLPENVPLYTEMRVREYLDLSAPSSRTSRARSGGRRSTR